MTYRFLKDLLNNQMTEAELDQTASVCSENGDLYEVTDILEKSREDGRVVITHWFSTPEKMLGFIK
jgi:hypothetical protein